MNGTDIALKAQEMVNGPIITYAQMDCQAFVEEVLRQNGIPADYRGSNDMYRNACSWVGTLDEAKRQGKLIEGCLLFIVQHNGNEPARYKNDGKGNANHVGIYLGSYTVYDAEKNRTCDVAHSSASRGKVCGSTLKNAWTHVGLLKGVEYGVSTANDDNSVDAPASAPQAEPKSAYKLASVEAESGSSVKMRAKPSRKCSLYWDVPVGADIMAADDRSDGWTPISYHGRKGYMMTKFISRG